MTPVLQAVPNFSDGRDPSVLAALVEAVETAGAEVLDASADPDHNRSVITLIGAPVQVEQALLAAARVALERIDLTRHEGCHPRIGALDVCPLVPLRGIDMQGAVEIAGRVATGIAALGIPVYLYGASTADRSLADLRRGGFEALRHQWPEGRKPDLDAELLAAHPTAGATCVGARRPLLAWNVWVAGLNHPKLLQIAAALRQRGGGIQGLRTLALSLPRQKGMQLSMNLEAVDRRNAFDVFRRVEQAIHEAGGQIERTEIIGMIPDALVFPAGAHRLRLSDPDPNRMLDGRVRDHLLARVERDARTLADWVLESGSDAPEQIRDVAGRFVGHATPPPIPGEDE